MSCCSTRRHFFFAFKLKFSSLKALFNPLPHSLASSPSRVPGGVNYPEGVLKEKGKSAMEAAAQLKSCIKFSTYAVLLVGTVSNFKVT